MVIELSNKKLRTAFLVMGLLLPGGPLRAEYVFLKNGGIVQGEVLDRSGGRTHIRLPDGTRKAYSDTEVLRVQYGELSLGKVFVRKNDGEEFEAYLVDEDRRRYVFRRELHKPAEFDVPRTGVLFITRTNPTDLAARPEETGIRLSWHAPYRPPKGYRVYMRNHPHEEYRRIGECVDVRFRVSDLIKKTPYYFIVKAVNERGEESLPTNEAAAFTNIPPEPPGGLRVREEKSKDGKTVTARLAWRPSRDEDGRVTGYVIYRRERSRYVRIGETTATAFEAPDLEPGAPHEFIVSAVDDNGAESERPRLDERRRVGVAALGGFSQPMAESNELLLPSFFVGVFGEYRAFEIDGFRLSGVIGCSYFSHKGKLDSRATDSIAVLGLWCGIDASYAVMDDLSLGIKLLGGYAGSAIDSRSENTRYASGDFGLWPTVEIRYYFYKHLYVSLYGSYVKILYDGNDFDASQIGGGLGCLIF